MHYTFPKTALLAGAVAFATLLHVNVATAQTTPAMTIPSNLSMPLLQAHKADIEAMIADLARVQTPAAAKEYEAYVSAQIPKYVQNHKALHNTALANFEKMKPQLTGAQLASLQAVADGADKLSETHFPRVAAEMDRVEKLNPGLKKQFDILRNLD